MASKEDFARVTSSDGCEFFLERSLLPKNFPLSLPYESHITEKIMEYLHYRHINANTALNKLHSFPIHPQIALDLLKATIDLKI